MLAGAGEISYRRFVTPDVIGSIVYASLGIVLGATVGAIALERVGGAARAALFLGGPRHFCAFSRIASSVVGGMAPRRAI
jgi:membrane protein DedA with SNARE-associated domain